MRPATPSNFNSRPCTRGDTNQQPMMPQPANFNSRPCTRGDYPQDDSLRNAENFNSRPCTRGDALITTWPRRRVNFNSRPCTRGDAVRLDKGGGGRIFQFTPLHEGRPLYNLTLQVKCLFQFTPLHEGRRQKICVQRKSFVQSSQIIAL